MASVLSSLAENLANMAKSAIKMRSIPVEDLRNTLRENIKRHKRVSEMIVMLSTKEYQDLYSRYSMQMKNAKLLSAKVYEQYVKGLQGKAQSDENKFFMNSLATTNADFVKILTDIEKNVEHLVGDKHLSISNVRMTAISVLGIIRQSDILVNFTMYLYGQFTTALTGNTNDIPNYRCKYLMDNVDKVSLITTQVRNHQGAYMFLDEAKQLRGKNADMVLNATGSSVGFLNLIKTSNYTKGFLDNLDTVLAVLNIFRWTQEKWDDYKYACYQSNKETLAWMENNVAMLRMDLANVSQDDPKYQHLKKVVDAYDAQIAAYDKKIKEYEDGE